MNRLARVFAVVLACQSALAADPPDSALENPGKVDQLSQNGLETPAGKRDGSVGATEEVEPVSSSIFASYTPAAGSAERGAIMDGVRGAIVTELSQVVIFKVEWLRVCDGWAFLKEIGRAHV